VVFCPKKTLSSGGSGMLVDQYLKHNTETRREKTKNYKLVSYTEAVDFKMNGSYPL
jgi:hypothetical protein